MTEEQDRSDFITRSLSNGHNSINISHRSASICTLQNPDSVTSEPLNYCRMFNWRQIRHRQVWLTLLFSNHSKKNKKKNNDVTFGSGLHPAPMTFSTRPPHRVHVQNSEKGFMSFQKEKQSFPFCSLAPRRTDTVFRAWCVACISFKS